MLAYCPLPPIPHDRLGPYAALIPLSTTHIKEKQPVAFRRPSPQARGLVLPAVIAIVLSGSSRAAGIDSPLRSSTRRARWDTQTGKPILRPQSRLADRAHRSAAGTEGLVSVTFARWRDVHSGVRGQPVPGWRGCRGERPYRAGATVDSRLTAFWSASAASHRSRNCKNN
jgi:hypothetical protein